MSIDDFRLSLRISITHISLYFVTIQAEKKKHLFNGKLPQGIRENTIPERKQYADKFILINCYGVLIS